MTLHDYLSSTDITEYNYNPSTDGDRAFPVLELSAAPTLTESEVEKKCLIALVNQNNQLLTFLNSVSGIKVATLCENLGGVRRAANVAALLMAQKIEDGVGEGLGLIHVPGETGGAYANLFMPSGEDDGNTPEDETILTGVWTAQTALINQQSAYLDDIKATFTEKRAHLPVGFSMDKFVDSSFFKYLAEIAVKKVIDLITDLIPGQIDDIVIDNFSEYGVKLFGAALCWLQKVYYAGSQLCERMKAENGEIAKMTASWGNYSVRSGIITQHDMSIQSLMAQVSLAEQEVMEHSTTESLDKLAKSQADSALQEPIIQCPHTGDFIFTRSFQRIGGAKT